MQAAETLDELRYRKSCHRRFSLLGKAKQFRTPATPR
ncbi:MAG: hypothetical protein ACI87E_004470 [Mariniblastus sp.]